VLRHLYTALCVLALPLVALRLLLRGRAGYRRRWHERFGRYDQAAPRGDSLWLHAVSVGESIAAVPLVRALHELLPGHALIMTTTTPTGAATVERLLGDVVQHVYFPYDLPWVVERFVRHFRPRVLVTLETELWPNTFRCCRRHRIPVVIANARLSERSLARYRRTGPLARDLMQSVDFVAAQSADDRARFIALGAPSARVEVHGSLKFDVQLPASVREEAEALRRELGVNRPTLMAGSTRPGEEAILLEALRRMRADLPDLLLVLAPRHPERCDEVADLCAAAGYTVVRRSMRGADPSRAAVFLIDGMGELPRFYRAADVAFVGGSLLPFGGHNVLEPAGLGVPVLVGPYTYNFSEICRQLAASGALHVVTDAAALAACAGRWLGDSNERDRLGAIAREFVASRRGATQRTAARVHALLSGPADAARAA
jgi:3-deoxy-D-manno-octulosonic-acid transferase